MKNLLVPIGSALFYFSAHEVLLVLSYLKPHVFIKLITSFAAISNFYGFFSDKNQRLPSSSTFRNDARCLTFFFSRWEGILSIKLKVSTLLCKLLSLCLRPNPRIHCSRKRLKLHCRRSHVFCSLGVAICYDFHDCECEAK